MVTSEFATLYAHFHAPITNLNCGDKCAPYNERGAPFCCDTRHAVPTAYQSEWAYLQANTNLWHLWEGKSTGETSELREQTPPGQVLIACLGHEHCQREFRSITCRSFPFFPYINSQREFIGMSYYWEYEDRCWVISNLEVVSPRYRHEFTSSYETLFETMPGEIETFHYRSAQMRSTFSRSRRAIPLLHRNGRVYKITAHNERMRRVRIGEFLSFGWYEVAKRLPFPDE
jgi:hypothetical protein